MVNIMVVIDIFLSWYTHFISLIIDLSPIGLYYTWENRIYLQVYLLAIHLF